MKVALEEIVKEIKGAADYVSDTYREVALPEDGEDTEEDLDFVEEYRVRLGLGL